MIMERTELCLFACSDSDSYLACKILPLATKARGMHAGEAIPVSFGIIKHVDTLARKHRLFAVFVFVGENASAGVDVLEISYIENGCDVIVVIFGMPDWNIRPLVLVVHDLDPACCKRSDPNNRVIQSDMGVRPASALQGDVEVRIVLVLGFYIQKLDGFRGRFPVPVHFFNQGLQHVEVEIFEQRREPANLFDVFLVHQLVVAVLGHEVFIQSLVVDGVENAAGAVTHIRVQLPLVIDGENVHLVGREASIQQS